MNKKLINIVHIPKIKDDGFLFFAQNPDHIPFDVKRVYYITEPVAGLTRGKHAHKKTRQLLFCLRGKVRMLLSDGVRTEQIVLKSPEQGIMLEKMVWHDMLDMDENTILLVLASEKFDPKDYIRDYEEFLDLVQKKKR